MALLTIDDIYARIYKENVDEITRVEDDATENALVDRAIIAAEQEAKMYLTRYDLVALFGEGDTAPTTEDMFLKNLCVDIACWNLTKLGHPNVDFELTKFCYETGLKTLRTIQSGITNPQWPYRETTGQTAPNGSAVVGKYFKKRKNNF